MLQPRDFDEDIALDAAMRCAELRHAKCRTQGDAAIALSRFGKPRAIRHFPTQAWNRREAVTSLSGIMGRHLTVRRNGVIGVSHGPAGCVLAAASIR